MKRFFKQIHLWLSLPAGILIFILCITGAILVFQKEIQAWADTEKTTVSCQPGDKPQPFDRLIRSLDTNEEVYASLTVFADPEKSWYFSPARHSGEKCWINPYNTEVLGEGNAYSPFFSGVRRFHRWLAFSGEGFFSRQTGRVIIGISTFAFLGILLSGLYIAFPKKRSQWKQILRIQRGKNAWTWWFTSHRALGWYCCFFLLLMALTGPMWSFPWYRSTVAQLLQAEGSGKRMQKGQNTSEFSTAQALTWEKAYQSIQTAEPDYTSITFQGNTAAVQTDRHHRLASDTYHFDSNGQITAVDYYKDLPRSRKLMSYNYLIHTGEWGGLLTKTLYFLACLGGAFLTLSGYWLYIRSYRSKSSPRKQ